MAGQSEQLNRPRAVTLVAWLHVLQALALLVVGWVWLVSAGVLYPAGRRANRDLIDWFALGTPGGTLVAFSLLGLAVAFGLFSLRPWAWLLAMTLQGLGLATALSARITGTNWVDLTMVLGIIIVLSLNQEEVRRAFRGRGRLYD